MLNCWKGFKRTRKTWNFKARAKKSEVPKQLEENNNQSPNNKTPAAILYELLSKKGKWPVYEIVAENPLIPHFKCRVSCEDNFGELWRDKVIY